MSCPRPLHLVRTKMKFPYPRGEPIDCLLGSGDGFTMSEGLIVPVEDMEEADEESSLALPASHDLVSSKLSISAMDGSCANLALAKDFWRLLMRKYIS